MLVGGIAVLAGGVGGARYTRGLVRELMRDGGRWGPEDVTVVVSVGDDLDRHAFVSVRIWTP